MCCDDGGHGCSGGGMSFKHKKGREGVFGYEQHGGGLTLARVRAVLSAANAAC